ncbi:MAG: AI-2E family transporter [Candidatus Kariarchaeaceae archaeon]
MVKQALGSTDGNTSKGALTHYRSAILLFFVFIFYLFYITIKPMLSGLILGFGLAYACLPISRRLEKRIKSKNWRATAVMAVILIPIFIIAGLVIVTTYDLHNNVTLHGALDPEVATESEELLEGIGININATESYEKIEETLSNLAFTFVRDSLYLLSIFTIFVVVFFFLLRDGEEYVTILSDAIPDSLKTAYDEFFNNLTEVLDGLIYSVVLSSLIEGFVAFFLFWIFGFSVPMSFLLALLIFLTALLPILGTPMIFIPATFIVGILHGSFIAVIFFILATILLFVIPNFFLSPYLATKYGNVHVLLPLLAFIAGPFAFGGVLGFVLGPMIISFAVAAIRTISESPEIIWGKEYYPSKYKKFRSLWTEEANAPDIINGREEE